LSVPADMLEHMPHISQYDRRRLVKLLDQQHDIISRAQALDCDLTARAVGYRTRPDGPWRVVLPGVYAIGTGRLTRQQRAVAAFLYAGKAIAITGVTAVRWHGLRAGTEAFVDVLVPQRHRRSDAGFVRLRRTSALPGIDLRDGVVSYAPLERAVADAARILTDMREIRDVVATGVQAGKVSIWQLLSELDRGAQQGSARLRACLAEVSDGVRSVAEADLRSIIRQFRLPPPVYNPALFAGGQFLASPDAWWPDYGVVAEVDSRAWHLSPADWEQTMARGDRMTAEGILVLRFPPAELRKSQAVVAKRIKATLAASRGPLQHIVTRPAT